jgi:hypothetical protein
MILIDTIKDSTKLGGTMKLELGSELRKEYVSKKKEEIKRT